MRVNKIKLCHLVKNQGSEVTLNSFIILLNLTQMIWCLNTTITPCHPPAGVLLLVPAQPSACPLLWFMDVVFLWYLNNLNANPIYKIIIENSAQLHHHLKLFIVSNPKILFKSYLLPAAHVPLSYFYSI